VDNICRELTGCAETVGRKFSLFCRGNRCILHPEAWEHHHENCAIARLAFVLASVVFAGLKWRPVESVESGRATAARAKITVSSANNRWGAPTHRPGPHPEQARPASPASRAQVEELAGQVDLLARRRHDSGRQPESARAVAMSFRPAGRFYNLYD